METVGNGPSLCFGIGTLKRRSPPISPAGSDGSCVGARSLPVPTVHCASSASDAQPANVCPVQGS